MIYVFINLYEHRLENKLRNLHITDSDKMTEGHLIQLSYCHMSITDCMMMNSSLLRRCLMSTLIENEFLLVAFSVKTPSGLAYL